MSSSAMPSTEIRYRLRFPERSAVDQDEEWCEVEIDGETRRLRFHDYADIYDQPGLYEQLFYDELKCDSPRVVAGRLRTLLRDAEQDPQRLRVLDIGAGNGMVGEQLRGLGAGTVVGIDILEEAARAAERDRPDVYDDYFVADLTDLSSDARDELTSHRFNCLTTVAALGFGDIPPAAFAAAYDLVETGGLIAMTIKETFITDSDGSGFANMIRDALETDALELLDRYTYTHRLAVAGEPLAYVSLIAVKRGPLLSAPRAS